MGLPKAPVVSTARRAAARSHGGLRTAFAEPCASTARGLPPVRATSTPSVDPARQRRLLVSLQAASTEISWDGVQGIKNRRHNRVLCGKHDEEKVNNVTFDSEHGSSRDVARGTGQCATAVETRGEQQSDTLGLFA